MLDVSRKFVGATAFATLMLSTAPTFADSGRAEYEVTITNLTSGQVFSPPIVATHRSRVSFFQAGEPASEELALIAEGGNTGPFAELLEDSSQVGTVVATASLVPPGESVVVHVVSSSRFSRFSVAGMLVNTNDVFFAIDTQVLPRFRGQVRRYTGVGYDAGSEANNEDCAFIPGPACPADSGNARDEGGAEGFVFVSSGVHGVADLDPVAHTWLNPVVTVTARRVR